LYDKDKEVRGLLQVWSELQQTQAEMTQRLFDESPQSPAEMPYGEEYESNLINSRTVPAETESGTEDYGPLTSTNCCGMCVGRCISSPPSSPPNSPPAKNPTKKQSEWVRECESLPDLEW
jgi:hypothetical protein